MAIPSHLTPEQCGALAAAALPMHLVLTHFYPPVERVDIRAAVGAHYGGPITLDVLDVVRVGLLCGDGAQVHGHHAQALGLVAPQHFPDQAASDRVGLEQDQRS